MRSDQTGEKLEAEDRATEEELEPGAEPMGDMDGAGEGGAVGADTAALEAELSSTRDRYLRLAAEFENYRKRTERERGEGQLRGQAQLVERLLEPLDDLQRVAQFGGDSSSDSLVEGVQMVQRKLLRALEAAGLEEIDAKGKPFDPEIHDALMTTEAESREEDDTVGEVFQPGYRFRGMLLRPSRVQVKKHQG
jgi:molecular chaperone GrpE